MSHSIPFRSLPVLSAAIILLISCGGEDQGQLVTGDGVSVTEDDFHREFERLLPDDQVSVLEPGGKFDLVTRLAYREMLLLEAGEMELPDLDRWMEISSDLWLARRWLEEELETIYEAGLDTSWIDSMMSIDVSISAVLMGDSLSALRVLDEWRGGEPEEPGADMALSPWSQGGSSYFDFQGDFFSLYSGNPDFAEMTIEHAGLGPSMESAFGAWAVFSVDTSHTQLPEYSVPAAARFYISSRLAHARQVTVVSRGVEELAGHLTTSGSGYSFTGLEDLSGDIAVAVFPGGELTALEVVSTASLVADSNFFHGVPEEFIPFLMPEPMLGPGVDLWVYVEGIAEVKRQADLAAARGIQWPDTERELTMTDQVLKDRVLEALSPVDTAAALDFYYENSDLYRIPELRSILVAYVPSQWMPEGEVGSFDQLERFYSRTDAEGDLIPTDPCPRELFSGYGEAVFAAPESVFTGPVEYPGDDVSVYFEVVEVIPEGESDPAMILPLLMDNCRQAMVNGILEDYLLELWDSYSIEIDSGLVRQLDPWDSGY